MEFSDKLASGGQGPVMVIIPAGRFWMGSPKGELERRDDERQHEVKVAHFAIGKYTVTVGQFRRFAEAKGYQTVAEEGGGMVWTGREWKLEPDINWRNPGFSQTDDHPVVCVSLQDVRAYVTWLSAQTNLQYRLPTEAEWEYACRAGTAIPFYFGATISTDQANYNGNYVHGNGRKGVYRQKTVEVGQFPPNAWGLHDMHGNVWEWTCSVYDSEYAGGEQCCYGGNERRCMEIIMSSYRALAPGYRALAPGFVLRGGSWCSVPDRVRGAARRRFDPRDWATDGGFRLARTFP